MNPKRCVFFMFTAWMPAVHQLQIHLDKFWSDYIINFNHIYPDQWIEHDKHRELNVDSKQLLDLEDYKGSALWADKAVKAFSHFAGCMAVGAGWFREATSRVSWDILTLRMDEVIDLRTTNFRVLCGIDGCPASAVFAEEREPRQCQTQKKWNIIK